MRPPGRYQFNDGAVMGTSQSWCSLQAGSGKIAKSLAVIEAGPEAHPHR
jgi:hypothetical protein